MSLLWRVGGAVMFTAPRARGGRQKVVALRLGGGDGGGDLQPDANIAGPPSITAAPPLGCKCEGLIYAL